MKTWYWISGIMRDEVSERLVLRETESFLVLPQERGCRKRKVSKRGHFRTKIEAYTYLVDDLTERVKTHARMLSHDKRALEESTKILKEISGGGQ